jgi:N-sulfoglucosamine sulfohydrolase
MASTLSLADDVTARIEQRRDIGKMHPACAAALARTRLGLPGLRPPRRAVLLAMVMPAALASLSGPLAGAEPGAPAVAARRNIVLFISDDESPTLGCYGDPVAVTPAVDALAADGTVFLNAYATTASCSASRSVILSGLHNHANGQYGHQHDFHKFASWYDVVSLSLPRALAEAGYRTAITGKFHVAPEEVYHFEHRIPGPPRNAVAMAEACREFITAADERPFFLYIATSDPHRGGGTDAESPLELKPDLFGNLPRRVAHPGVTEVFFDPAAVPVPPFLPDTPATRSELAHYYQSCSRVDQGLARLVEILRQAGAYDRTLIVFTSDHGMAFPGGKTTVYEGGLRVPLVVRDPFASRRGVRQEALVSHIDITPTLLDFAGGLDREKNRPARWIEPREYWKDKPYAARENRGPRQGLGSYHGRSWLGILGDPAAPHHEELFASHTFHEIQMYYPMRAVRDRKWKLIWNIAHPLPFPFASDLWEASAWQTQLRTSLDAPWGPRTVGEYIHRPAFELYDLDRDPHETKNLAADPAHAATLEHYQGRLRALQRALGDRWESKWDYE